VYGLLLLLGLLLDLMPDYFPTKEALLIQFCGAESHDEVLNLPNFSWGVASSPPTLLLSSPFF